MKYAFILITAITLFFLSCGGGGGSSSQPQNNTPDVNTSHDTNTTDTNATTSQSMRLIVTVPALTPDDEFICLGFNDANPALKMQTLGTNRWQIDINESSFDSTQYKYCRNCECDAADESFDDANQSWRVLAFQKATTQEDNVTAWRWLSANLLHISLDTTDYQTTPPNNTKTDFFAGVMLNDWWKHEWIDSIDTTMKKITQDTNATWIQYAPVPEITQLYPTPIIKAVAANGTSDADLLAIIKSAHTHGLKVFLNPSPWAFDADSSPEDHNQTWWNDFRDQWKPIMLHYAQIAQDNDVEMLEFKMWPNIDAINDNEKAKMNDLASGLLDDVKSVYTGKIAVQSICYDVDRPVLDAQRNGDYLAVNIWSYYPWHLGDTKDDNVSSIYNHIDADLDACKNYYDNNSISKPVIIEQLAAASYDGAIIGAVENDEDIDSFHENNDSYTLDLQEQADVYEATLHAISQKDWIEGNYAFTYFYWDSVGKDINIRAKPAQNVIAKWYGWMR